MFVQSGMLELVSRTRAKRYIETQSKAGDYFAEHMVSNRDPQMVFALALMAIGIAVRPVFTVSVATAKERV